MHGPLLRVSDHLLQHNKSTCSALCAVTSKPQFDIQKAKLQTINNCRQEVFGGKLLLQFYATKQNTKVLSASVIVFATQRTKMETVCDWMNWDFETFTGESRLIPTWIIEFPDYSKSYQNRTPISAMLSAHFIQILVDLKVNHSVFLNFQLTGRYL